MPEVFVIVYVPLSLIHPTFLYFVPAPERIFKEDTITFTLNSFVCVEGAELFADVVVTEELFEFSMRGRYIQPPIAKGTKVDIKSCYTIDYENKLVVIVRFLYQKSNWNAILHKGIPLV